MSEKSLDKMLEQIDAERKRLREAENDYKNSVLSDNRDTQTQIAVIVGNRRYSLTRYNDFYAAIPRPGYEMMLLAAKKMLAQFIRDQKEMVKNLEAGYLIEAESRVKSNKEGEQE